MNRIVIVGGGAAGMAAALTACQTDPAAQVVLLEHHDRVGKKILATGNGRCNLTNEEMAPSHYVSQSPEALPALIGGMPTSMTLDFFRTLGLYCTAEDRGRVYPYCRQAAMVLDVLRMALRRRRVQVVCGCTVTEIRPENGGFVVTAENGETYPCDSVVLSVGGKASPKLGGDGTGYPLAAALGHSCTPLFPCLTPLRCKNAALKGLKGIRTLGEVTLFRGKEAVASDRGEIQLTEYGLSGIPIFQLSCRMGEKGGGKWNIRLDLLPDWTAEDLAALVSERIAAYPQEPLEHFLLGLVHKKILYAILKAVGAEPLSQPAASLTEEMQKKLVETLKGWHFPVIGPLPWDSVQVTGGGIPLTEVELSTLESKCQPGLYLAGEVLDVAGECGGYNLHWAWCSGILAGRSAAK